MMARFAASACLLAGLAAASPARAEALGRLFFTPAERRALDGRKQAGAAGQHLTLEGRIARSDGKASCWISDARSEEAALAACPDDRGLKVGETIVPATGERQDRLAGGQVLVHRQSGR